MIHYLKTKEMFSDSATPADRRRIQTWMRSDSPSQSFARNNAIYNIAESSPTYDNSPLTGPKVRKLDPSEATWSWYVGDVRWDQAIDTDAQARQQAVDAVEQARVAAVAAGVPIILPPGSALDGVDASGQTVRLHLGRDQPEPGYWQQIDGRNNHGVALPEFDVMEGRIVIDIKYLATVIVAALTARSLSHSSLNRAKSAISLSEYDKVLAMVQEFAAQGPLAAVDIDAIYTAGL